MTKNPNIELIKKFKNLDKTAKSLFKRLGIEGYITNIIKDNSYFFKLETKTQKDFKIAIIADRFTTDCFLPECNIIELIPSDYKNQINDFKPDIIFLESAWEGKDKLWYKKVVHGSKEIFDLIDFSKSKNIPVIFWNKEDPVYTDQFMPVAQRVDFVFTTDLDCVIKYKNELGHNRVYHLHFAAQPQVHNPIEKYDRKHKACFAGAYYHRYPRRIKVFDSFAQVLINGMGLDIYDRNYKNARPEHAFPKEYDKYILGQLDPSEIDIAYKSYDYGINMNSIQQSQTMFARRVFELMASNTVVIGNYSRGVKNYFGDLTICTDDASVLKNNLDKYCADELSERKYKLAGLRLVLSKHLYEDRLDFIINKVFGKTIKPNLAKIEVVSVVNSQEQYNKVLAMFKNQTYNNKTLTIISKLDLNNTDKKIKVINNIPNNIGELFNNSYVAYFEPNNYYGKNYILDLVLNMRYTTFDAVGKSGFFAMNDDGKFEIPNFDKSYKKVKSLFPHSSIVNSNFYKDTPINSLINNTEITNGNLYCADQFNFCINCYGENPSLDAVIEDEGLNISKIDDISLNVMPNANIKTDDTFDVRALDVENTLFDNTIKIKLLKTLQGLIISSNMDNTETSSAIYNNAFYSVRQFLTDNKLSVIFEGMGDLSILGCCIFYDKDTEVFKVEDIIFNTTLEIDIPQNVNKVKFGIKVIGGGNFIFKKVIMGTNYLDNNEVSFLSRNDNLLICKTYPHYEIGIPSYPLNSIQSLFNGQIYDVICVDTLSKNGFREFNGINIYDAHEKQLKEVLNSDSIKNIVIYNLDNNYWNILKQYTEKSKLSLLFDENFSDFNLLNDVLSSKPKLEFYATNEKAFNLLNSSSNSVLNSTNIQIING